MLAGSSSLNSSTLINYLQVRYVQSAISPSSIIIIFFFIFYLFFIFFGFTIYFYKREELI